VKKEVLVNGNKKVTFSFYCLSNLTYYDLVFNDVMCFKDKKTGHITPIPFEKDRIQFIGGIATKDKGRIKVKKISPRMRYNLRWLYNDSSNSSKKSKPGIQTRLPARKKDNKNNTVQKTISVSKDVEQTETEKKKKRAKRAGLKVPIGSVVGIISLPKEKSKQDYKKKKRRESSGYIDAMNYRLPGSYGTSKRR